ncbi:MAG: hypothetical protein HY077_13850 [Elusimicrobia bacterium]|nr:hypothetical protein [Elusimicrobiota bacterium]
MKNARRDSIAFVCGVVTLASLAAAQPSRGLPSPTPETRAEYGIIAVAQSRFSPDTDPAIAKTLAAAQLQERLRAELLKRVSRLKGYTFSASADEPAPTWLEVRVERVVLAKSSLVDPDPALVLRARARLIQPAYGRSLYDQKLEYRSPKRSMNEWTRYDAAAVHRDLEEGLKALAQKAADDIFLVYAAPRP